MNFIVYDKTTGEIIRTGICPEGMMQAQLIDYIGSLPVSAGKHSIMEGNADQMKDLVDISTKQILKGQRHYVPPSSMRRYLDPDSKEFKDNKMIREKMDNMLRDQAIKELKKEGKL